MNNDVRKKIYSILIIIAFIILLLFIIEFIFGLFFALYQNFTKEKITYGDPDYSCNVDHDCAIKYAECFCQGNGPVCVNKSSSIKKCEIKNNPICFDVVETPTSCACQDHKCVSIYQ